MRGKKGVFLHLPRSFSPPAGIKSAFSPRCQLSIVLETVVPNMGVARPTPLKLKLSRAISKDSAGIAVFLELRNRFSATLRCNQQLNSTSSKA
jgi:hypothetical protein